MRARLDISSVDDLLTASWFLPLKSCGELECYKQ